jgi:hypothetical protein
MNDTTGYPQDEWGHVGTPVFGEYTQADADGGLCEPALIGQRYVTWTFPPPPEALT